MRRHSATSVIVLVALASAGCAPLVRKGRLDYRTVKADPNHDTDRAKLENQRAIKFIEKGKTERAEAALQQALIADVGYGPAHNNLGKLYYTQGNLYLSAWEFEYAGRLMPRRPECQNNLGLVYESAGKLDEAINCYALAHETDPKNAAFMGNLARAKFRRGDNDPELADLLNDLQFFDSRPDWVRWAGEQLALGRIGVKAAPASGEPLPKASLPRLIGPQSPQTEELPPPAEDLPAAHEPFDVKR
ncbi:MAG TPA: tetratricopeptide repeat protein [Pirellulales bacterium]|nr:tetratricopeptide repeat protein [Pirellulales bacterium]